MECVDRTGLSLDHHARDGGVRNLHGNSGNRLKAASGGWTKVHWLSSHHSANSYRRVRVPAQPVNRQSNEGAACRLSRLDRESRLRGCDAERDEHRKELNDNRSFGRSHSRIIHAEFADSATRHSESGTKKRWT
jgi:hypothetical protein